MGERTRFGAKMLSKMGWKEGDGLGAKQQGIKDPLIIKRKRDMKGVGGSAKPSKNWDPWWESVMKDAYGEPATSDADLFEACEGARCRPHGSAKLARIARSEERKGRRYYEGLLKESEIEIDAKMEKRLAKLQRLSDKEKEQKNDSSDSDDNSNDIGREIVEIEAKIERKVEKAIERRRKREEVVKY